MARRPMVKENIANTTPKEVARENSSITRWSGVLTAVVWTMATAPAVTSTPTRETRKAW